MKGAVITGVGLHGPLGDLAGSWQALLAGRRPVAMRTFPSAPGLVEVPAAPAAPLDLAGFLPDPKLQKYMGRVAELAVLAAGRALRDAQAAPDLGAETALFATTDLIAFELSEAMPAVVSALREGRGLDHAWLGANGFRGCHPLLPFKMLLNMPLGMVSIAYGLRGDNFVNYPNAQQSAVCLETALRGLDSRRFPRALVGASAHPLSLAPLVTALRRGRVAADARRADPAAPDHQGIALADAGAFLLLESPAEAQRRGAPVRGTLRAVASRGPDAFATHAELASELAELMGEVAAEHAPGLIITTGFETGDELAACGAAARRCWGGVPALVSFDGALGYAGAAGLICAVALGGLLLREERLPAGVLLSESAPTVPSSTVLVLARDEEAALSVALLGAEEADA